MIDKFEQFKNKCVLNVIKNYTCYNCKLRIKPAMWEYIHRSPSDWCELDEHDVSHYNVACQHFIPIERLQNTFELQVQNEMLKTLFNKFDNI